MSNHRTKSVRKKSSHFSEKIWIRREALKNVKKARVLDCFHGTGKIWNRLRYSEDNIESVLGIERNKRLESSFRVIKGNNIEILKTIPLVNYNVFDLDSYGYPVKQMDILFKRLIRESVIIYTMCYSHLVEIPKEIDVAPKITEQCKTIITKYSHEMFSDYLLKHGVKKYYEYSFENEAVKKYYGYFIYNPKNDLTRNLK